MMKTFAAIALSSLLFVACVSAAPATKTQSVPAEQTKISAPMSHEVGFGEDEWIFDGVPRS